MGNDCREFRLSEVARFSYGKMPRKELLGNGEYPIFSGYKYQYKYPEYNCDKGDVIVVARGVGGTGNVKLVRERCYLTNLSIKIELDLSKVDSVFFYYRFLNSGFRHLDSGSAQSQITINDLNNEIVWLPSIAEQKSIAHILGTLDDKIELNRQMNATLEAMARARFKSWFVDFDPVIDNALAAGNPIPEPLQARADKRAGQRAWTPDEGSAMDGTSQTRAALGDQRKPLPAAIQQQLPNRFVISEEMGWLPEGWEAKQIKDFVEVTDYVSNGSFAALKSNVTLYDEPEYALYIRTTDYKNGFSPEKAKYIDRHSYEFLKKSVLNGDEVIISNVGDTGTVFKPPRWLNKPMTLGSNAIALKADNMSNFLHLYFSSHFGQNQISGVVGGSAQPKFNKTDFRSLNVYFGSRELVTSFENYSRVTRRKIESLMQQSSDLVRLRDTLLPKLLSGQLRIPEAEAITERAGVTG